MLLDYYGMIEQFEQILQYQSGRLIYIYIYRRLGPGGRGGGCQLLRHMGPLGPKIGGDPHACNT